MCTLKHFDIGKAISMVRVLRLRAAVNHGVDEQLIAQVFEENRKFFALPIEQKRIILADSNNRHALPSRTWPVPGSVDA